MTSFLRTLVFIFKLPRLHRFPLFRRSFDRLRKIRIAIPLHIQGFWLKPLKLSTFLAQVHELETTELCRRTIQRGWTVVDLGAGDGYFTILFSKLVGPQGKVFAFEPDEINLKNLRANVERNGCRNVVVVSKAVTERTGKVKFFSADTKGMGSLFYESPGGGRWVEVDSVSLDDYFRDYTGGINFFKMDIEGGESAALRGMEKILSRTGESDHGISGVVELSPHLLDNMGIVPEDFPREIKSYGFRIYSIDDDGSIKILSDQLLVALARQKRHINIFVKLPRDER